ncbi:hypothetical protein [Actinocorallia longicatena]|uniref:Uncharacterized protein n=1 Tax=Actinocorallia longicatena TaxID=111803 RepID=A0ABP6Q0F7_9ACTN
MSTPSEPNLARLLDVAAADGRPGELAGHDRALAAFRAVHHRPPRRRFKRPVLAALVAATLLGGAGMAAATGDLPGTGHGSGPHRKPPSPSPALRHKSAAPVPRTAVPPPPAGTNLTDLCRTLLRPGTRVHDLRAARARRIKAFRTLSKAAGGHDRIRRFCEGLIGPTPLHDTRGHDHRRDDPRDRGDRPTPAW